MVTKHPSCLGGEGVAPGEGTHEDGAARATEHDVAKLRALLDAAVDGIITINEVGIIESVNRAVERLFGYTPDELIGKNVKVLMPAPYRAEHDGYLANYRESGEKKIIGIGREVVARRKDGSTFPIDLAVSEIVEGKDRAFLGIIRDASQRHEAREALQRERDFAEHLLETAHAIVLVLDPLGRIVRYNRYLEELSGCPLATTRGHDWFDTFIPRSDQAGVRAVFERAVSGVPTLGFVNPITTENRGERQIEWYSSTLSGTDGAISGVLAVGLDITDRARLEEQFRQVQKMEAVGRLAGGIAHDFNTLLGSITGYSEMLLDRLEDDDVRRPTEQIHRCAERGASLTRQLLAFSRRQVAQTMTVDLTKLIDEMNDMLSRLVGDDIEIEIEIEEGPFQIEADPTQMEQVIMNLVVNAVDAMPRGGRIRIMLDHQQVDGACPHCGLDHAPGPYVRLRVSDTGCGIEPVILDQVFEPFFTTKPPGKGTGLGLSTTYGIVTQAGGCVSIESEVDCGTTFFIMLSALDGATVVARDDTPPVSASREPTRGSETVMVVEDDEIFRDLIGEILGGQGYAVLLADEPMRALALLEAQTKPVDLLVSDIVMPGMTGSELARQLTSRYPSMKVLLMSGYNDEDRASRGCDTDECAFIEKPFATGAFLLRVRALLDE